MIYLNTDFSKHFKNLKKSLQVVPQPSERSSSDRHFKGYWSYKLQSTYRIQHEWSLDMKLMKKAFGEYYKSHMKRPGVQGSFHHMTGFNEFFSALKAGTFPMTLRFSNQWLHSVCSYDFMTWRWSLIIYTHQQFSWINLFWTDEVHTSMNDTRSRDGTSRRHS